MKKTMLLIAVIISVLFLFNIVVLAEEFESDTDTNYKIYYQPEREDTYVGDVIPYYNDGTFNIFYLKDFRGNVGRGEQHPWYRVSTDDFIGYKEYGEMIPSGSSEEYDYWVGTGSVIEDNGTYHAIYSGHNHLFPGLGKSQQSVLRAVSEDLENWKKIDREILEPSGAYNIYDFRDPFIFYNEEEEEYWMLITANRDDTPIIALYTAKDVTTDLSKWKKQDPFFVADEEYLKLEGEFRNLECPDLFKMGDYWYLIFSDQGWPHHLTRYRMSNSLEGPWEKPKEDIFDSVGLYAAKTISDGENRYLIGWLASKADDLSDWKWAGNLIIHQLDQEDDGTLTVQAPDTIKEYFSNKKQINPYSELNNKKWKIDEDIVKVSSEGNIEELLFKDNNHAFKISTSVSFDEKVENFGFIMGRNQDSDWANYINFDINNNELNFFHRPWDMRYQLGKPDIKRDLKLIPGEEYQIEIFIEGSVVVMYINNQMAMTVRAYGMIDEKWGLFSENGEVVFNEFSVFVPVK